MQPVGAARRRAWRAMLSAIAGGGLTAAGLAGPFSGGALGAGSTTPPEGSSGGSSWEGSHTTWEGATPSSSGEHPSTTPTTTSTTPTTSTPTTTTGTTPQPAPAAPSHPEKPSVVLQHKQRPSTNAKPKKGKPKPAAKKHPGSKAKPGQPVQVTGANNVALPPQLAAGQAAAIAAALASSSASVQALGFYRIPLFLLPIYKAAAVQYGVPWQILAAINEIETNYGSDQSVSTAGAVGWMQFMPATWLQYGVDALNAGYADPYNPVDAVFAAARYLRAAGAAKDLPGAIFAYNHSQEYVDSVLLRAKLISSYPKGVIATLTGLVDGRLPVTGAKVAWSPVPSPSSATAGAVPAPPSPATPRPAATPPAAPGSSAAPSPSSAAAAASHGTHAQPLPLDELTSEANANVVAVQDGRVVQIASSRELGTFLVLRDVYGDLFTYAGLGSVAPTYAPPKSPRAPVTSTAVEVASHKDPAPSQPASAGRQPVTLHVTPQAKGAHAHGSGQAVVANEFPQGATGKVRLYAHPGNPDARAVSASLRKAARANTTRKLPLRRGSVVASGTVLGRVHVPSGAQQGHLRFAVRPAGDPNGIDPGPVLANWAQLAAALHPQGAKAQNPLLGATASDVFLMSNDQLERTVLSDPGITLEPCARHDVASGKLDRRTLAVLAFLSRSGLKPRIATLSCAQRSPLAVASSHSAGDSIDISAVNGVPISGHQGAGTITDLTIRTLLTLPDGFVPQKIASLMRYPGAPNTQAASAFWSHIHLSFAPAGAPVSVNPASAASARSHATPPAQANSTPYVSASQWNQLMTRIGQLPAPLVSTKPSSSAIPDPTPKKP